MIAERNGHASPAVPFDGGGSVGKRILDVLTDSPQTVKKVLRRVNSPVNSYARQVITDLCRSGLAMRTPDGLVRGKGLSTTAPDVRAELAALREDVRHLRYAMRRLARTVRRRALPVRQAFILGVLPATEGQR